MRDPTSSDAIVTPEAVALAVDVAGLGSRMIAALIDALIQGAVAVVVGLAFAALGGVFADTPLTIAIAVVFFVLLWGYYPLFEGLSGGTTPGKRAQRLRVVQTDGQPVTFGPVLIRNLIRIVDFLPGGYGVGALAMIFTRRSQRLGDLAAGTIVVRERPVPQPQELELPPSETRTDAARRIDTTGLGMRDYELARSFLERRATLDSGARSTLGRRVAETLRPRVAGVAEQPLDDETFLEAVVVAFRNRFTGSGAPGL